MRSPHSTDALQLGFLNRDMLAEKLAPLIDGDGRRYSAEVTAVTGGGKDVRSASTFACRRTDVGRARARARCNASDRRGRRGRARADRDPSLARIASARHRTRRGWTQHAGRHGHRTRQIVLLSVSRQRFARSNAARKRSSSIRLRALANDQFDALERGSATSASGSFAPTARSTAKSAPS